MIYCEHCGKELEDSYIRLPCPNCGEVVWEDDEDRWPWEYITGEDENL